MENQAEDVSKRPQQSLMLENESTWLYLAITGAFVLLILMVASAAYVFADGWSASSVPQRIDTVYKIGIFGAGLVTFCTVVWRGLVSIRQATAQVEATNNQTKQIALTQQQIDLSERNELAKLFQKGVELLYSSKNSDRSAGISTLEVVATTMKTFDTQSFDQIVDGYQELAKEDYDSAEAKQFRSTINRIHDKTGMVADRHLRFAVKIDSKSRWVRVKGVNSIRHIGGKLSLAAYGDEEHWENHRFTNTEIYGGTFAARFPDFMGCNFTDSNITAYTAPGITKNSFTRCNFSSCRLSISYESFELGSDNFYYDDMPPFSSRGAALNPEWIARNLVCKTAEERLRKQAHLERRGRPRSKSIPLPK